MLDEVAERVLQAQGFGGEGVGGRAEKLKLDKQSPLRSLAMEDEKSEIARRRARITFSISRSNSVWSFSPPTSLTATRKVDFGPCSRHRLLSNWGRTLFLTGTVT